jgi:hypothetical protein
MKVTRQQKQGSTSNKAQTTRRHNESNKARTVGHKSASSRRESENNKA